MFWEIKIQRTVHKLKLPTKYSMSIPLFNFLKMAFKNKLNTKTNFFHELGKWKCK